MRNIENYKKRFYLLMESEMGDVKPLISEDIFSSLIGKLARTARKFVSMSEDDIMNAFRTTESALGKEIDDLVSNVMKSKKLADIETLEAKLVQIFDPSGMNPKMAQEQTKKFLNGFAKSKNKTGWGQIRNEVSENPKPFSSGSDDAFTSGAKTWANSGVGDVSRFSKANFSVGTNYQTKEAFNKIMAQELDKFKNLYGKQGFTDINQFFTLISSRGFEGYGIKNFRDFLRKNIENVTSVNSATGNWQIKFKPSITPT